MSKVEALNLDAVTPKFVLEKCAEHVAEFENIFIVALDKNGPPRIWLVGPHTSCAIAGGLLTQIAVDSAMDLIPQVGDP